MSEQEQLWLDVTDADEIPPELLKGRGGIPGQGKWEPLRQMVIKELWPKAQQQGKAVSRIMFATKKKAAAAQSALSAARRRKKGGPQQSSSFHQFQDLGFGMRTRTQPVGQDKDGAYYLWVEVTCQPNQEV